MVMVFLKVAAVSAVLWSEIVHLDWNITSLFFAFQVVIYYACFSYFAEFLFISRFLTALFFCYRCCFYLAIIFKM